MGRHVALSRAPIDKREEDEAHREKYFASFLKKVRESPEDGEEINKPNKAKSNASVRGYRLGKPQ
ncbi:hypothetical protein BBBOND_0209950 [Babesia bigemina]|uniref:Uncharacterized protein n=1 Tax=Babesia bigemina TaxID=5866 RepID=A0A061D798_BABBI|nr:hypothetical protein BBBOND_0209950 [Babesia bigemina]CDR95842.1 hypothetical protein BBBOND_0209950 [Babesia bigemina]|eukprot:XP_012768028.1 hypothetical protein BBBOND_0209950 [Babesia bigemina]